MMMRSAINGVQLLLSSKKQRYAGEFFNGKRGWADLEGHEATPFSGATSPQRNTYQTGVSHNSYDAGDIFDITFHLRHWIAKDGDNTKFGHIHAGISEGSTASGSNLVIAVTLGYSKLYAAGRNMAAIAPISKTFTATPAELNAAAGNHILLGGDTLLAQNGGGAGLWNSAATGDNSEIWIPDDIIIMSCSITSAPTITGGSSSRVFIFRRDIHEEVLFGGSPNRAYSFWN